MKSEIKKGWLALDSNPLPDHVSTDKLQEVFIYQYCYNTIQGIENAIHLSKDFVPPTAEGKAHLSAIFRIRRLARAAVTNEEHNDEMRVEHRVVQMTADIKLKPAAADRKPHTFIEFKNSRKDMTPNEYLSKYGYSTTGESAENILTYADCGLHILYYGGTYYTLHIDNEEYNSDNLIEMELRLFKFFLYEYSIKHIFTTVNEKPGHQGRKIFDWYIAMIKYVRSAERLLSAWYDGEMEELENTPVAPSEYYPTGLPSFDEHTDDLQEWRNILLTKI